MARELAAASQAGAGAPRTREGVVSPVPPARVRLDVAKNARPDVWMTRDPTARLGLRVKDVDPEFARKYMRTQAAMAVLRAELFRRTGL